MHGSIDGSVARLVASLVQVQTEILSMTFCTDIRVPQRMNLNDFKDRLHF